MEKNKEKDPTLGALLTLAFLWKTDELLVPLVMRLKH